MFGSKYRLLTLPLSQRALGQRSVMQTQSMTCCKIAAKVTRSAPTYLQAWGFGRALGVAVVCLHSMAGKIATLASPVASHDSNGILNP